jgi:hypothetical protein
VKLATLKGSVQPRVSPSVTKDDKKWGAKTDKIIELVNMVEKSLLIASHEVYKMYIYISIYRHIYTYMYIYIHTGWMYQYLAV